MCDKTLAVGDVVYLKSHPYGPALTVTDVGYENNTVQVSWFDQSQHLQQDRFPVAALTPASNVVRWNGIVNTSPVVNIPNVSLVVPHS